jgi:uncharacterized protein YrrD
VTNKRSRKVKRETILGLPVIDGVTGKRLGFVKDLYPDKDNTRLEGFYVTRDGWGNKIIRVPFSEATIGHDAVITESELSVSEISPKNQNMELKNMLGKKVMRDDGAELGVISDIILDPLTGRIEGLELSDSVFSDLLSGRNILPYEPYEFSNTAVGGFVYSGETLLISQEQAENIMPGNRGIKNLFYSKLEGEGYNYE